MDRRGFIAGAAGAAGGVLASASAAASRPRSAPHGAAPAIASYATGLRELGDADGPGPALAPGAPLRLTREPGRAYDPDSVAVAGADGRRLGYLPPCHGRVLAPLMDAGLAFEARVVEARRGPRPALSLAITLAAAPSIG